MSFFDVVMTILENKNDILSESVDIDLIKANDGREGKTAVDKNGKEQPGLTVLNVASLGRAGAMLIWNSKTSKLMHFDAATNTTSHIHFDKSWVKYIR